MVGGKGFKNPYDRSDKDNAGSQSTRIQKLIEEKSELTYKDQFFWRIALDKNCPPSLRGRADKLKSDLTLREVIQLLETLEIESAIEEAINLDEKIKKAQEGGRNSR